MEQKRLIEAIETVRRDKHQPWRYILFTFLNGIAQGLGMALGMTVVLGLVIYFLTIVLTRMIDFPVVGQYVGEILKLLDANLRQGVRVR